MEIRFLTKEESNKLRQEAFVKLSPAERLMSFFELSRRVLKFPTKTNADSNRNNFVLKKN